MEKSFQGRNTKEDELFFPREKFSLSAIRQLSAERSEARQSDQGKGKVLPRKEKRPRLYFPSQDTIFINGGHIFFPILDLFNHKS